MVAAILDFDAQTGAAQHIGEIARLRRMRGVRKKTSVMRKKLARTVYHGNFRRLRSHTRRDIGKYIGMQVNHATRNDNKRLKRKGERMADSLARLRLGLSRHGARVDDNKLRVLGVDKTKTRTGQIRADTIALNTVDTATEVNHGNKRCSHVFPR